MPAIPRCTKHTVRIASCEECAAERDAEREAARRRLEEAAR